MDLNQPPFEIWGSSNLGESNELRDFRNPLQHGLDAPRGSLGPAQFDHDAPRYSLGDAQRDSVGTVQYDRVTLRNPIGLWQYGIDMLRGSMGTGPYDIFGDEPRVPMIPSLYNVMRDEPPMVPRRPSSGRWPYNVLQGEPNSNLFGYEFNDSMRQWPFFGYQQTSPGKTLSQEGLNVAVNLNGSTSDVPAVNNVLMTHVADSVGAMRTLIQQQIQENNQSSRGQQDNAQDLLHAFLLMKPNSFSGTSNPDGAYGWLQHICKKLDAMKCPEDDQVRLATHMLTGHADTWWNIHKEEYINEHPGQPIPWKWFEKAFMDRHFPYNLRRARKLEFENLNKERRVFKNTLNSGTDSLFLGATQWWMQKNVLCGLLMDCTLI